MKIFPALPLLVLAVVLAACSTVSTRDQSTRYAAYQAAAGAPVNHFQFVNFYSWEPLGEQALAVYTRPRQAWLLDLAGPCRELPFANSVGLSSNANQVWTRFDKVYTGRDYFPCTIARIRPVDVTQLKRAEQQQRQVQVRPRAAPQPQADNAQ